MSGVDLSTKLLFPSFRYEISEMTIRHPAHLHRNPESILHLETPHERTENDYP